MTKLGYTTSRLLYEKFKKLWNDILPECSDLVVIHSSLMNFQFPKKDFTRENLKEILIHSLKDLTDKGLTIALPAFTFEFCRGGNYCFRTSTPETGVLASWFLNLEGALRTPHPIYSFATIGPRADELRKCKNITTFGADSTFEYFEKCNATIVMFGCGWQSCTQLHRYEEILKVPYRYYKDFKGKADFGSGFVDTQVRMFVRNIDLGVQSDFSVPAKIIERSENVNRVLFYGGDVESMSVDKIAAISKRELKKNPLAWIVNEEKIKFRLSINNP